MKTQPSFWKKLQYICHKLDLLTVLFSIILGTLIWFYVNSRRIATRQVRARVEITVPDGWQIDSTLPRFRNVVLRGPQQLVQSLRQDDLRFTEKLAFSETSESRAAASKEVDISLKSENLKGFPRDMIEVVEIPEPKISLTLVRPIRKYIPVDVELEGTLPEGYVLKEFQHSPQYIPVVAPEDDFTAGLVAKTRPIDLTGRTKSFVAYTDFQPLTLKNRVVGLKDSVFVQFTLEPKAARKTVENVPVSLLLATPMEKLSGHRITPSHVNVTIEGSENVISTLNARNLTVYIDSRELGTSAQSEYTLKCRALEHEGVRILKIAPAEVKWKMPKEGK